MIKIFNFTYKCSVMCKKTTSPRDHVTVRRGPPVHVNAQSPFSYRARATHPLAHTPARAFALHRDARRGFYSVDGVLPVYFDYSSNCTLAHVYARAHTHTCTARTGFETASSSSFGARGVSSVPQNLAMAPPA